MLILSFQKDFAPEAHSAFRGRGGTGIRIYPPAFPPTMAILHRLPNG